MIKKTLICDRCGKMIDTAYRIEFHSVDVEEEEGNYANLGKGIDYCVDCLEQIALCANNGVVVAAETQQEPELTVPDSEQVEEAPVETPAEPAPKRYRAKTLYLMQQAGKTIDQIAEETGYTPENVYKKLKKFKEAKDADSQD